MSWRGDPMYHPMKMGGCKTMKALVTALHATSNLFGRNRLQPHLSYHYLFMT